MAANSNQRQAETEVAFSLLAYSLPGPPLWAQSPVDSWSYAKSVDGIHCSPKLTLTSLSLHSLVGLTPGVSTARPSPI
jgi:hypothetical protein